MKIAQYYDNKKNTMQIEVKSSYSPVASSKYFFMSWTFCEGFFLFISHNIFRCQKEIKNESSKWSTLTYTGLQI